MPDDSLGLFDAQRLDFSTFQRSRLRIGLMRKRILAPMLTLVGLLPATSQPGAAQAVSQPGNAYVPTESQRIRRAINTQNWDDGGELTHYAYLHMSEVFPTADIHRHGPISVLEEA